MKTCVALDHTEVQYCDPYQGHPIFFSQCPEPLPPKAAFCPNYFLCTFNIIPQYSLSWSESSFFHNIENALHTLWDGQQWSVQNGSWQSSLQ